MIDRRIRRSRDPYRALCLQLEVARSRGKLDALVLGIDNGLMVAGAGEPDLCEALSAAAPFLGDDAFPGSMPEALDGQNIQVRALRLLGETLFVASAGQGAAETAMQRSINGVRRIIGGPRIHP
ncbi:MAG: hypothetical protein AAF500_19815 [Myxococcota bacterium]